MMILNRIAVIASLMIMGCAGTAKPAPVMPPTPVAVAPREEIKAAPAAITLSETLKEYKGSTWAVSFPDNMIVDAQDDESIKVKAADGSMMTFIRQDSADDLATFSGALKAAFAMKGHQPAREFDMQVAQWPAKLLIYVGARGVAVFSLFTTGTHSYALIYVGPDGRDRLVAFKSGLDSVVVSDKAVVVKK